MVQSKLEMQELFYNKSRNSKVLSTLSRSSSAAYTSYSPSTRLDTKKLGVRLHLSKGCGTIVWLFV